MDAGLPRAGARAGPLILYGCGLLATLAVLYGEGSSYNRLVGIGTLALLAAGTGLAVGLWGLVPLPRPTRLGLAVVGLLAALVVWMGLSVLWSVAPDRSWDYFNRGLVYLAFLGLGLLAGAWRPSFRWIACGTGLIGLIAVLLALAGKVIPDLFPDGERVARLRAPLAYWNALAVVTAFVILFGLWAATRRRHRLRLRVGGVVAVFAATVALMLTYSRGGLAVTAIVVAAFVYLVPERVQTLAALAIAVPPALAISIWGYTSEGIVGNLQPYDTRLHAGLVLGLLLLLGGAAVAFTARYLLRVEDSHASRVRLPTPRQTLVAGAAAAAVVVVVAVAGGWAGRALDDFTNPASIEGQNPGRVASFSSSRRWDWWTESWKLFRRDPLEGAGAGSFYVARRPFKTDLIVVVEPHSLPIQLLGETGIVGFLLLLGVLGAGTAAVIEALRRLDGEERVAATVVALAVLAYLLHTLVDYDWDFVALTGPVLLLVGLLLTAGVPLWEARRRPILASSAALFAVVGVLSLVAPWQSDRKVTQAYDALDRRDAEAALKDADSARSWNPVAIEPVHAAAAAEEARGNRQKALQLYAEAVELQPENPVAWYELAKYEDSVGLRNAAIRHVGRAQQLDPKDEATVRLIQKLFAPPA